MSESFRFLKHSSRIICLPCNVCANFISLVSFLWRFFTFSKAITSFCCFGAGEHLGHPCRWQPRNWNNLFVSWLKPSTACPAIFLSPLWPHVWWWTCTPSCRAFQPPDCLSGIRYMSKKAFHMQFRAAGFVVLGTSPLWLLSCKSLDVTADGTLLWILLDILHMHNFL